jgi:hypothetical protein
VIGIGFEVWAQSTQNGNLTWGGGGIAIDARPVTLVGVDVLMRSEEYLSDGVTVLGALGSHARLLDRGEKEREEQGENADAHEQFDQCERRMPFNNHCVLLLGYNWNGRHSG